MYINRAVIDSSFATNILVPIFFILRVHWSIEVGRTMVNTYRSRGYVRKEYSGFRISATIYLLDRDIPPLQSSTWSFYCCIVVLYIAWPCLPVLLICPDSSKSLSISYFAFFSLHRFNTEIPNVIISEENIALLEQA